MHGTPSRSGVEMAIFVTGLNMKKLAQVLALFSVHSMHKLVGGSVHSFMSSRKCKLNAVQPSGSGTSNHVPLAKVPFGTGAMLCIQSGSLLQS